MKTFIRLFLLCLIPITQSTVSVAAESVHLFLKGNNGKTYKTSTDASGKFSFDNVEPGKYELVWVLPDGTTPDKIESAAIEIESFSWGVSQMSHHGSSTSSNLRTTETPTAAQAPAGTGRPSPSGPSGGAPTGQPTPPPGIQTGGGGSGGSSGRTKSRSNIQNNFTSEDFTQVSGGKYCAVLMKDVVISSLSGCEGTCGKMAINEKGVPVKKKGTH